jgi:hypothetical protein
MADAYNVASHTPHTVTLKKVGLHIGPATVVLQRTQIAAVRQKLGEVVVDTTDGRAYGVKSGVSREQRGLVKAAFGL